MDTRIITGQLRLGDAETTRFDVSEILAKIDAAKSLAGLSCILLLPSRNQTITARVMEHCKNANLEVYLWYKTLADNDILPDDDELDEHAWGKRGAGESGIFNRIFDTTEAYVFACPRNRKYNALLQTRCASMVRQYDGLFADCIGFPLPSLGLETFFSCFCPTCMEAEPRLRQWREKIRDLRESTFCASDAELEKWGTMENVLVENGLGDFLRFRQDSIFQLTESYAQVARGAGKQFALDLVSPSMVFLSGHDYARLCPLADWIKPRIYFRVFGPSALPVELYSLTMGLMAWGKRFTIPGILRFIERSTGLKMPNNVHSLAQNFLSDKNVINEITRSNQLSTSPVHPGFECSLHPDYNTGVDEVSIKNFLSYTTGNPGLVLSWNLLYVPDHFLRTIGENL